MEIKLLSGALGAEILGLNLKVTSEKNFKKINDLFQKSKNHRKRAYGFG